MQRTEGGQQLGFVGCGNNLPLFGTLGSGLLDARVCAGGKLGLELLDTTGRVDVLQLAGEEGMAGRANIDLQLLAGAARREAVAAAAGDNRGDVIGVDAFLHGAISRPRLLAAVE